MSWVFATRLALAQLGAEIGEVFIESVGDVVTDMAIDSLNDKINELFPQMDDPNSLTSKILMNMKMQTTVKAQARMTASAMNAQNKLMKKVDDYKDKVKKESDDYISLKGNVGAFAVNCVTLGKLKKKVKDKTDGTIVQARERANMTIQGQRTAHVSVGAYSQGLGTTKQSYDNANDMGSEVLASAIMRLINDNGHYT